MKFIANSKIFLYLFFLAVSASLSFLYFFDFSSAYEDKTTHRALTDEIVDFYNLFYEQKITDEQKEWIVQGSRDEDIYPRWMNHYYDPVYNAGWQGERSGYLPDWFVEGGARALVTDKKPISSLDWMRNQELQTSYSEFGGNRTWDRALYEMVKNNNEQEAYYTLGFILHLMEDATVPDHTRNDSHAPGIGGDEGSPYEQYADQFTRENFSVAIDLRNAGYKPVEKNIIDYYLHSLALYSNKNFFSKDTIFDEKYEEPNIVKEDNNYGYGIDIFNNKFKLVFIDRQWDNTKYQYVNIYRLGNKDAPEVLNDYFALLSRQAITNGTGIINLFHKEAEKARQNPENLIPPPEFKTANQAVSLFSEINKNGVYRGVADAFERAMEKYAIYKPIDFTANLAASALESLKTLDPKYLVAGFRGTDVVEEVVNQIVDTEDLVVAITTKEKEKIVLVIPPAAKIPPNDNLIPPKASGIKTKFIIDGDTFILEDDTRIRLIGIDAPEENECFYDEAKNMLADLILGKEIILEKDISDADKYGRLLRYGRINNILINDYMIREGFAEAWAYGSDIKYREQFAESQNYAQNNKSGMWKECDKENQKLNAQNQIGFFVASIGNNNPPPVDPEPEPQPEPEPEPEPESEPEQNSEENDDEPDDTTPPITPFDINIADGDIFALADDVGTADGTQINIFGKGEEDSIVIISVNPVYEAEAASNGTWQKEIKLNEGENEIKIKAKDEAGNESAEIIINVTLDSVGPTSQINFTNYNLMSLTFNVGWFAAEEDAATTTFEPQYKIGENGEWQDLEIENGGGFENAQDKTNYYFRVRVQDINGNQGDWSEIAEAEINIKPIIFNEIAWMGTLQSPYDEWIELYNTSNRDVDIAGWQITAGDWNPNITIQDASVDSFVIKAKDYFLLERSDDESVFNIAADFIYSGTGPSQNMMTDSELLRLKDGSGKVIDEIGAFYAGQSTSLVKKTMERVRSDVGSDVSANWLTYEGEGSEAQDAGGNPIFGTPKFLNSVNKKYYAVGGYISENTTFYAENNPYFIYSWLTVAENKTLEIEPGAEIQIADNIQITIDGTLKSHGEEENNIIFTSSKDSPQAGDWKKIYFSPTSQNSEVSYASILYGGRWTSGFGGVSAAVEVATSTVAFDNILISDSMYRGLWLKNSETVVNNVTFNNINTKSGSAMLEIDGGNPQINSSIFKNSNGGYSSYGINILEGANPIISGNSFVNTHYPIYITEGDPVLSENTASGNSYNGILFSTGYEVSGDVVLEKDLPYYVNSILEVKNSAVLMINAGVEIRFNPSGSFGQDGLEIKNGGILQAMGEEGEEIKFTAAALSPSAGYWKWIYFGNDAGEDSVIQNVIIEYANIGIKVVDGAPEIILENISFNENNTKTDPVDLLEL